MNDPSEVIGRRIGAFAIDFVPQIVIAVALALAIGERRSSNGNTTIMLEDGEVLLWLALVALYFFVCEAIWGQSPGKRVLGLVVVGRDGQRAGVGRVAVRNLLRPIDSFPFYLIGLLTMLLTEHKQRVGDLAAGTFVTRSGQGQPPAGMPPSQGYGAGWGAPGGAAPEAPAGQSGWAPPAPPPGPPGPPPPPSP